MDWICYACSVRVSELRREAKRSQMTRPTAKGTSISSEHSVIISNNDNANHITPPSSGTTTRRTTQETIRTSFSKVSNPTKAPKSVRFVTLGHADCAPPETADEKMSSFSRLKHGVRRRWKRVGRCLRCVGRKMERPVISVLMRLGY